MAVSLDRTGKGRGGEVEWEVESARYVAVNKEHLHGVHPKISQRL